MGQAQRSDRRSVSRGRADHTGERRRKPGSAGSIDRGSISVISGGSSRESEQHSGRRRADHDELEDLELWEISRENDDSRMMRLADSKQVRHKQKPFRTISYYDDQNMGSPRPVRSARRRRARKRKLILYRLFALFMIGVCLVLIYQTTGAIYRMVHREKVHKRQGIVDVVSDKLNEKEIAPPEITEDLLEVNDYSRPGTKLKKVKSVFVHYTANPGTSAAQNRSYFANLAETRERSASAHLIIGYDGEVIQCIPLEEQAYAVVTRNEDSVSIECCYLDEDGKFTQETYDTLVHTLAWLMQKYQLSVDDILRHYDCGGKKCPLYYVEHEDAWEELLADVEAYKESL